MAKAATKLKTANIQEELEKEATFFLDEASKYGKLSLDQKLPTYGRNYYRELTGVALAYIEVVGEAEGVDFISDENTSEHLTPAENKALYDIAVKTRYGYRD